MNRLLSTMKNDVTVQVRNNLYAVGIGVSLLVAVVLSQLANASQLAAAAPALLLLIIGGSTMLYVAGMILFERDEGTLNALMASPLRTSEYLWSKIITLTALATLESALVVGGAMFLLSFSEAPIMPSIPLLLLGILAIGVVYTLIGIILIVRYERITDYLMPMAGLVGVLQLPFLHFWGAVEHWSFLIIPTSAPTMIMQGGFKPLAGWAWGYALVYTTVLLIGLTIWAYRAYYKHIRTKAG